MEDELVLIAPPDFELGRISHAQLAASTLLLREQGSGSRHAVETAFAKARLKISSFKNVIKLDSTQAIKSAAEAGLGVGFVPACSIHKELELRALKVVEVEGLRVSRDYFVVSLIGPAPSGAAGAFRSFALESARRFSTLTRKSARSADILL